MSTILIVDDEPMIVDLLVEIVEEWHHTAITAGDGCKALCLAQEHHPALIISDIRMPKMDGLEFLQALRADPDLHRTTVILVSAHINRIPTSLDTQTIFVPKPIDLQIIEGVLQRLP